MNLNNTIQSQIDRQQNVLETVIQDMEQQREKLGLSIETSITRTEGFIETNLSH